MRTFDLDTALAAWRRSLRFNRAFLAADLDELEDHIRAHVEGRTAEGVSAEAAYREALARLGGPDCLEAEYRKIRWGRTKRRAHLWHSYLWGLLMLKNYAKVTVRNFRRHPGYLFINVFGLALGLACCILIFLFVRDELSFDRFHDNADRLYRVAVHEDYGDNQIYFNTNSPLALAETLDENFPEVETTVRVATIRDQVRRDGETFSERMHLVDSNFFEVFDFPLVDGAPGSALADLKSVVLSRSAAERYFGSDNPVGQELTLTVGETPEPFRVTGVAEDAPSNSSIRFEFLLPFENGRARWSERAWGSFLNVIPETYVRLAPGADASALEAKVEPVLGPIALGDEYRPGTYRALFQPITDIHLNTEFPVGIEPISDPRYATILGTIALLILLIACINFTALSLGRSVERAKEVGVRKVVGAGRMQLVQQFWSEALVTTLIALLVGLALAFLLLPTFNRLAGKELALAIDGGVLLALLGLLVVVGLVAGSYPAVMLSGFRPIEVLQNRLRVGGAGLFRRALTVVQFALAIMLMIGALLMGRQLDFLQQQPLGFDEEAVVVLPTGLPRPEGTALSERLRAELAGHDAIANVGVSMFAFGEGWARFDFMDEAGNVHPFTGNVVDPEFIETMGMHLAEGRNFSRDISADPNEAVVVNESFVRAFGWDDPLREQIPGPNFPPHRIVGVVEDFNFESLHSPVEPLALVLHPSLLMDGIDNVDFQAAPQPKIAVRLRTDDVGEALAVLEAGWKTVAPDLAFSYTFVDDALDQQYRQEQRLGTIVRYATIFSILIACLGLFGLAALTAAKRTKEIGIRKVLGASAANVVLLLTRDIVLLVGVAFVLAVPAAYLFMQSWLQDFAYRAPMGVGVFVAAGLLVAGVALLTVGIQALRAALNDPVQSLRYE